MELREKIQFLAKEKIFDIKKLVNFGDSYAVILPKNWVELHGVGIDGNYYVTLKVENSNLIFSPIDETDIKAVTVKEK